jgi:hypothetical protein
MLLRGALSHLSFFNGCTGKMQRSHRSSVTIFWQFAFCTSLELMQSHAQRCLQRMHINSGMFGTQFWSFVFFEFFGLETSDPQMSLDRKTGTNRQVSSSIKWKRFQCGYASTRGPTGLRMSLRTRNVESLHQSLQQSFPSFYRAFCIPVAGLKL